MGDLAKESGDIEALVAIKSRDLSNSYDFLNIAEIYKGSATEKRIRLGGARPQDIP